MRLLLGMQHNRANRAAHSCLHSAVRTEVTEPLQRPANLGSRRARIGAGELGSGNSLLHSQELRLFLRMEPLKGMRTAGPVHSRDFQHLLFMWCLFGLPPQISNNLKLWWHNRNECIALYTSNGPRNIGFKSQKNCLVDTGDTMLGTLHQLTPTP